MKVNYYVLLLVAMVSMLQVRAAWTQSGDLFEFFEEEA